MRFRYWSLLWIAALHPLFAQAPDIKIALHWSHAIEQLRIVPVAQQTRAHLCDSCPAEEWQSERVVKAAGGKLNIAGKSVDRLWLDGKYKISSSEWTENLHYPAHITAVNDSLQIVLTVPLEEYVVAVLQGEATASDPPEYLKAMAVLTRTFAFREQDRHRNTGFQLCDSTHCQHAVFTEADPRFRNNVLATKGEMLWYKGKPAQIFFHDHCGGNIAASQEQWPDVRQPYLKAHTDPYCLRRSPAAWQSEMSREELQQAFEQNGLSIASGWNSIKALQRSESQRVQTLALIYPDGHTVSLAASSLRFAVGRALGWNRIRSDLYEVSMNGGNVLFRGQGHGHGVGLCQTGAAQMAREHQSYRQILEFYFPGTEAGVGAKGFAWQHIQAGSVDVMTTSTENTRSFTSVIAAAWTSAAQRTPLKTTVTPQLKVYPDISAYRDATGEPGFIAAFTQGNITHIQPLQALEEKQVLLTTLRHEFLHQLVEANTGEHTPLWLREGLVLYWNEDEVEPVVKPLTLQQIEAVLVRPGDPAQMRQGYAAAKSLVQKCITKYGIPTISGWLRSGVPAGTDCR